VVVVIRRLLIANRGEIAVRVIRACRELGIESVSVCSDVDEQAPHAVLADHVMRLGGSTSAESYLAIGKIVDAARSSAADAVHPGYGFLAENAAFAAACEEAGLTFIGPPAAVIERMGSKIAARDLVRRANVPVVPGSTPADQTAEGLRAAAEEVGYPLLLKASAGGGGKGMRVVEDARRLQEAVDAARREALSAFGDGTLYVERLVRRPRHVEIQVLADAHGHVVHVFERECSIQRRHQKVIEESPSPALTPALRARMGAAAVAVATAAGYRNAGTIEFLVEGAGEDARFYFLEMNTRLQVEHAVTEAVTGIDLVRAQIAVAQGEPLPWAQGGLTQRGHAIECRVYAEDPHSGFLPQAGRLLLYREPTGPGVRVDAGVMEGGEVSVHYDPMLAKLIVAAEDRRTAIERARAALRQFAILGLPTNVPFLLRVLEHPALVAGDVDTGFIDRELPALLAPPARRVVSAAAAVAAAVAGPAAGPAAGSGRRADAAGEADPWNSLGGWGRATS
jgi:acetyl-CoA carboxylase biotin carboxylase subunit